MKKPEFSYFLFAPDDGETARTTFATHQQALQGCTNRTDLKYNKSIINAMHSRVSASDSEDDDHGIVSK